MIVGNEIKQTKVELTQESALIKPASGNELSEYFRIGMGSIGVENKLDPSSRYEYRCLSLRKMKEVNLLRNLGQTPVK